MIGVIIITHGNLGKEFLASAERILGKQEHVRVIPVHVGDRLNTIRDRISGVINDAEFPRQKIILVDHKHFILELVQIDVNQQL